MISFRWADLKYVAQLYTQNNNFLVEMTEILMAITVWVCNNKLKLQVELPSNGFCRIFS